MKKTYIISDEFLIENQKWICDRLKDQYIYIFPEYTTNQPEEADYIWYIAPWNYHYIPKGYTEPEWLALLERKKIVATIHHIDADMVSSGKYNRQFKFIMKLIIFAKYAVDPYVSLYLIWTGSCKYLRLCK